MAYPHPNVNVAERLIFDFLHEVISYVESKHSSIPENSSLCPYSPNMSPETPLGFELHMFAVLLTKSLREEKNQKKRS